MNFPFMSSSLLPVLGLNNDTSGKALVFFFFLGQVQADSGQELIVMQWFRLH